MNEEKNWNAIEEYVVRRLKNLEAKVELLTCQLDHEKEARRTDSKALEEMAANSRIYKVGDRCYIDMKLVEVTKNSLWLAKALGFEEELKDEEI